MNQIIEKADETRRLNETADNWIRSSVGKYCDVQLGKMLQNDPSSEHDELKPYLRAINIAKNGLDLSHEFSMWIRPQEAQRFRLKKGDILVSEGGDAGRTAVFDVEDEFYFQNAINRVRPNSHTKIAPEFIFYWFTFLKASGYVEMICNVATIPHFTAEKVKAAPLVLPPIETQRRIARFLDEKTAQIDALIEKKRALLDWLAEKRQALITRAVTKGLNPNVPMEPSGIDWLGDIPAHWGLRGLTKCTTRVDYRGATPEKSSIGVFLVTAKNIKCGQIDYEISQEYIPQDIYEQAMRRGLPRLGEVLFTTEAPLGEIAQVDREDIALAQRIIKFTTSTPELENDYLAYWMMSMPFQAQIQSRGTGSTAIGLKASKIVDLPCLLPPKDEQMDIISHVRRSLAEIDEVEAAIKYSLALKTEYRAALITAAITGQIPELNG